jgi:hypothetical protein
LELDFGCAGWHIRYALGQIDAITFKNVQGY